MQNEKEKFSFEPFLLFFSTVLVKSNVLFICMKSKKKQFDCMAKRYAYLPLHSPTPPTPRPLILAPVLGSQGLRDVSVTIKALMHAM